MANRVVPAFWSLLALASAPACEEGHENDGDRDPPDTSAEEGALGGSTSSVPDSSSTEGSSGASTLGSGDSQGSEDDADSDGTGSDAWSQSRSFTITNDGPDALADHQVLVEVPYDDAMQPDGSDLRFRGADGSELPYWIERFDAPLSDVWVRVPAIAAGESVTLTVLYGNPDAPPGSDGGATFELWQAFGGDIPAGWSSDGTVDSFEDQIAITSGRLTLDRLVDLDGRAVEVAMENDTEQCPMGCSLLGTGFSVAGPYARGEDYPSSGAYFSFEHGGGEAQGWFVSDDGAYLSESFTHHANIEQFVGWGFAPDGAEVLVDHAAVPGLALDATLTGAFTLHLGNPLLSLFYYDPADTYEPLIVRHLLVRKYASVPPRVEFE